MERIPHWVLFSKHPPPIDLDQLGMKVLLAKCFLGSTVARAKILVCNTCARISPDPVVIDRDGDGFYELDVSLLPADHYLISYYAPETIEVPYGQRCLSTHLDEDGVRVIHPLYPFKFLFELHKNPMVHCDEDEISFRVTINNARILSLE